MITPHDYYLNTSLYEKIKFSKDEFNTLYDVIYSDEVLDTFCVACDKRSTFQPVLNHPNHQSRGFAGESIQGLPKIANVQFKRDNISSSVNILNQPLHKEFKCARNSQHKLIFINHISTFRGIDRELTKIGQYPSIADLAVGGLDKYKKILGQEKSSEFYKAIGLYAHGVGIGSFPYLRRIFEDLIEEAHDVAKTSETNSDIDYPTRMEDKILHLKEFLPSFLVSNRIMYSILSKGIHELTEDECLSHFELMKEGIEAILDEKLRKEEEEKRNKRVADSIGKVAGSIK